MCHTVMRAPPAPDRACRIPTIGPCRPRPFIQRPPRCTLARRLMSAKLVLQSWFLGLGRAWSLVVPDPVPSSSAVLGLRSTIRRPVVGCGQAERQVLAGIDAAADGDDDVLAAVDG